MRRRVRRRLRKRWARLKSPSWRTIGRTSGVGGRTAGRRSGSWRTSLSMFTEKQAVSWGVRLPGAHLMMLLQVMSLR